MLQCSGLVCGQEQNCTDASDLQTIYKTFAQNLAAFNVFVELLPVHFAHLFQCARWPALSLSLSFDALMQGPTEAQMKKIFLAWLNSSEGE